MLCAWPHPIPHFLVTVSARGGSKKRYDLGVGLRQSEGVTSSFILGMLTLFLPSSQQKLSKDTGLREQCGVEIIWTVYVTELNWIHFQDSAGGCFVAAQDKPHQEAPLLI